MRSLICTLIFFLCAGSALADQKYAGLEGQTVFENEQVTVQRFSMKPGTASGPHTHPGKQMEILLSDGIGILYEANDKEIVLDMKKGDIRWIDPLPEPHNFINTGDRPIEWYLINLK